MSVLGLFEGGDGGEDDDGGEDEGGDGAFVQKKEAVVNGARYRRPAPSRSRIGSDKEC
jgi:hypothetical protein